HHNARRDHQLRHSRHRHALSPERRLQESRVLWRHDARGLRRGRGPAQRQDLPREGRDEHHCVYPDAFPAARRHQARPCRMRSLLQAWLAQLRGPQIGRPMTRTPLALAAASAVLVACSGAPAQELAIKPSYDIWQAAPGTPVTELPEQDVGEIACGTNGGPPSVTLKRFDDFATCPAEASGLHEIYFTYDDEIDYIAR